MRKFFVLFLFVFSICGCRHIEYVSVPEMHTKYEMQYVHDTQYNDHFYTEYYLGDTLVIRDSCYYYVERMSLDTVLIRDTVTDPTMLNDCIEELAELRRYKERSDVAKVVYIIAIVALVLGIIYAKKRKDN